MPCNSFGRDGKVAEDGRRISLVFTEVQGPGERVRKMPVLDAAVFTVLLLPTSQIVSSYVVSTSCPSRLDHLAHLYLHEDCVVSRLLDMFSVRLSVPWQLGVCLIVSRWCPGLSGRVSELKYIPKPGK